MPLAKVEHLAQHHRRDTQPQPTLSLRQLRNPPQLRPRSRLERRLIPPDATNRSVEMALTIEDAKPVLEVDAPA